MTPATAYSPLTNCITRPVCTTDGDICIVFLHMKSLESTATDPHCWQHQHQHPPIHHQYHLYTTVTTIYTPYFMQMYSTVSNKSRLGIERNSLCAYCMCSACHVFGGLRSSGISSFPRSIVCSTCHTRSKQMMMRLEGRDERRDRERDKELETEQERDMQNLNWDMSIGPSSWKLCLHPSKHADANFP